MRQLLSNSPVRVSQLTNAFQAAKFLGSIGWKASPATLQEPCSSSYRERRFARLAVKARRSAALRELEETRREAAGEVEVEAPIVTKLEWSSPLEIIRYPDPRLRAVNARIGVFDDSLKQLSQELLECMYNGDDGVGLAAPQVGVNVRLMVFNPTGKRKDPEYVLVNPKIVSSNAKLEVMEEGCLSFPRIFADVQRPTQVKVKAQDLKGAKMSVTLTGWQARIFQHEYDHLQGVLFHDRMNSEVLESVKPKLIALEESFREQHPGISIQAVA